MEDQERVRAEEAVPPPFSELISRWLDEGERLSEAMSTSRMAAAPCAETPFRQALSRLRAGVAHHRLAVLVCAGLLPLALFLATHHAAPVPVVSAAATSRASIATSPAPSPPRAVVHELAVPAPKAPPAARRVAVATPTVSRSVRKVTVAAPKTPPAARRVAVAVPKTPPPPRRAVVAAPKRPPAARPVTVAVPKAPPAVRQVALASPKAPQVAPKVAVAAPRTSPIARRATVASPKAPGYRPGQ
jgi:hypothetical protein